jgi:hypothetical protein
MKKVALQMKNQKKKHIFITNGPFCVELTQDVSAITEG